MKVLRAFFFDEDADGIAAGNAPHATGITLRDEAFHVRVLGEISLEFRYGEATVQKKASGSHNLKCGHVDAVACNGRTR